LIQFGFKLTGQKQTDRGNNQDHAKYYNCRSEHSDFLRYGWGKARTESFLKFFLKFSIHHSECCGINASKLSSIQPATQTKHPGRTLYRG
jgi:hypothetical protein